MASLSADVVVVGGGLAGFAAALRAAEFGLKPIILEQGADEKYLCNTRITIGVFQVALHDMRGCVAAPLRDKYAAEAGPALRWLMGQGITTINAGAATRSLATLAPPVPRQPGLHWRGRAGDAMLDTLEAKLKAQGGRIERGIRARELIMENG